MGLEQMLTRIDQILENKNQKDIEGVMNIVFDQRKAGEEITYRYLDAYSDMDALKKTFYLYFHKAETIQAPLFRRGKFTRMYEGLEQDYMRSKEVRIGVLFHRQELGEQFQYNLLKFHNTIQKRAEKTENILTIMNTQGGYYDEKLIEEDEKIIYKYLVDYARYKYLMDLYWDLYKMLRFAQK